MKISKRVNKKLKKSQRKDKQTLQNVFRKNRILE
jgi:hypothetical protein